jgi:hypothetical protein
MHVHQPEPTLATPSVEAYYRDLQVRARILEYCGATASASPSAAFLVGLGAEPGGPLTWDEAERVPMSGIDSFFERGLDISRSFWDERSLPFLIELDYLNVDEPAEPFLRPAEVYFKLEAAYRATLRVFGALHLEPRAVVTGRGYQFVGQMPLGDPVIDRLAALVPGPPPWYSGVDQRRPAGVVTPLTSRHARAAAGLGLLLEYLGHLILRPAAAHCHIPVVFNGTIVGSGRVGRESVSIDFSHAGDPFDVRHMRVALSTYQWHRLRPDLFGAGATLPPLVALPRGHRSLMALLTGGRGLDAGLRAARRAQASLPDISSGIRTVAARYETSRLARFHREYLAERLAPSGPVRALDREALPPCLAAALVQPNDLLLKPEHLQHLVRGLLTRGWRASEIAALVQSCYEADHGWGDRWSRLDPRTRADFDVRVFAGLIVTGMDGLVDFNCVSAQEKDLCPRTGCPYDLRQDRNRLLATVTA